MFDGLSFEKVIDIADENGMRLTESGIGATFSTLKHLACGGTVANHPDFNLEEATIFLAAVWLSIEDSMSPRSDSDNG